MTASWSGLGVFWGTNSATIYVRPGRYTKQFIDSNDTFTLSFFKEDYKKSLSICGSVSGRDVNKVEKANLTPIFDEAKMVVVCKRITTLYLDTQFENYTYAYAPEIRGPYIYGLSHRKNKSLHNTKTHL